MKNNKLGSNLLFLKQNLSHLHIPKFDAIINEENPFFGYVSSLERALELVRDFENATTTKFTVFMKTKDFGATGELNTRLRRLCARIFKLLSRLCRTLVRPTLNIFNIDKQLIINLQFMQ